jgi:hypothetical protein
MPIFASLMSLVFVVLFWHTICVFLAGLIGLVVFDQTFKDADWYGIPSSKVVISNFHINNVVGVNCSAYNQCPPESFSATISNNSEKRMRHLTMRIDYYRCPVSKRDRYNLNGCNQVWPSGVVDRAINNTFNLSMDPHTTETFTFQNSDYYGTFINLNGYYSVLRENQVFEPNTRWYITYIPVVTRVID